MVMEVRPRAVGGSGVAVLATKLGRFLEVLNV